jgi:hypothetical protein
MTPRKGETRESESFRKRSQEYEARRPARGPVGRLHRHPKPQVGEGLELKGQSILVNPDGTLGRRWDKSHVASEQPRLEPVPPGFLTRKITSAIGPNGDVRLQYITSSPEEQQRWEAFWAAAKEQAKVHEGAKLPVVVPTYLDTDLLAWYPIGDPHLGLLSWAPETGVDFDLKIAVRDLEECMAQMVASVPAAAKATIVSLGDLFHAQDNTQLTPGHGNKLDVDSRFGKVLGAVQALTCAMTDLALQRHGEVTFAFLPGNHDPLMAAVMGSWLRAEYKNEPRVHVAPAFNSFYYERFGASLLGACHHDGVKIPDLPGIMAFDRCADWGQTNHHHWHCGHEHHREVREYAGCTVEVHNTLAARDSWAHGRGFRSNRQLSAIVYHRAWGEYARVTIGLDRVRAALRDQEEGE